MYRPSSQVLHKRGHVTGELLRGVAVRRVGALAGSAVVRQNHVETLCEVFDLWAPACADSSQAADHQKRWPAWIAKLFVVLFVVTNLECGHVSTP